MGKMVKQVVLHAPGDGINLVTAEESRPGAVTRYVVAARRSAKHRAAEIFYEDDLEACILEFERMRTRYPNARAEWRVSSQFAALVGK